MLEVNMCSTKQRGQSIFEAVLALALFAFLVATLVTMSSGSVHALDQGGEQTQAQALATEGIEAVKDIYGTAWNALEYATSSVALSGDNYWSLTGEGTTEAIGQYTRTIDFYDTCRSATTDEIIDCPGDYVDVHTKHVIVTVSWTVRGGANNVTQEAYITNWESSDWVQTNWAGGDGQSEWSATDEYSSDDGNIDVDVAGEATLLGGGLEDTGFDISGGGSNYDWPFTTSGNYTFDSGDIEVTGGVAQLIESGGGGAVSGEGANPDIDTDATGWTYADWEEAGNGVSGTHQSTGGNPSGYLEMTVGKRKSSTLSGLWEQEFITTVDNPTVASTTFDWIVDTYEGSFLDSFQLYVFVDSAPGNPTIGQEVWSSGEISGTTSWATASDIDISSKLGTAGTYYLKVAVRVITTGGGGRASGDQVVGFDNIGVYWEGVGGAGSYPTDEPSIYPTTSFTIGTAGNWSGFTETATKNGGEIYYQLSDDDGSTWQYWNGSAWATAGAANYNTATVVNTNIGSFSASNQKIRFKAFLESDGTQQVQLDNINITFTQSGSPWGFGVWDIDGGENTPTGANQVTGGNPDGYAGITIPSGNGHAIGGYWEQAFTTYAGSPSPATLDFDYQVVDFNGTPDIAYVQVYIDTVSGAPVSQVGSDISFSGEGSWGAISQYNIASAVTAAGTYYLKIAVYVETGTGGGSGPFTVGFDNIDLAVDGGLYETSGTLTSSAFDMGASARAIQVVEWDETIPTCSPACTVQLEVSSAPDSGGSPGGWTSWYGASGAASLFTNASGTIISTELNGNQWVRYRANLTGDGNDTPVLQEVRVNYK